jgi:hypothetical protein
MASKIFSTKLSLDFFHFFNIMKIDDHNAVKGVVNDGSDLHANLNGG